MASGGRRAAVSELILLRHATATAPDPAGDRERPLDRAGRGDAEALAQWIVERGLGTDLVLCSASRRTRQTLDIIAPALARPAEILIEDELYLAPAQRLLARLRRIPAGTADVMLIGHNPGLHELANHIGDLASGPLAARIASGFPAAALARYAVDVSWAGLGHRRARLLAFVTPKEIIRGLG